MSRQCGQALHLESFVQSRTLRAVPHHPNRIDRHATQYERDQAYIGFCMGTTFGAFAFFLAVPIIGVAYYYLEWPGLVVLALLSLAAVYCLKGWKGKDA